MSLEGFKQAVFRALKVDNALGSSDTMLISHEVDEFCVQYFEATGAYPEVQLNNLVFLMDRLAKFGYTSSIADNHIADETSAAIRYLKKHGWSLDISIDRGWQ